MSLVLPAAVLRQVPQLPRQGAIPFMFASSEASPTGVDDFCGRGIRRRENSGRIGHGPDASATMPQDRGGGWRGRSGIVMAINFRQDPLSVPPAARLVLAGWG